jgi:hypothetical protein
MGVLSFCDDYPTAEHAFQLALADAERRGSTIAFAGASVFRARQYLWTGPIAEAARPHRGSTSGTVWGTCTSREPASAWSPRYSNRTTPTRPRPCSRRSRSTARSGCRGAGGVHGLRAASGRGRTNRDIANALFITVKAVEWHLSNTYRKLHIRGRNELANALSPR